MTAVADRHDPGGAHRSGSDQPTLSWGRRHGETIAPGVWLMGPQIEAGGFDHASVQAARNRLYVAHTASDPVDIIDGTTDRYGGLDSLAHRVAGQGCWSQRSGIWCSRRTAATTPIRTGPDCSVPMSEIPGRVGSLSVSMVEAVRGRSHLWPRDAADLSLG